MKWWFKKPKKLNETTRLYALYGESANVEFLDNTIKDNNIKIDNQFNDVNNKITTLNDELTDIKNNISIFKKDSVLYKEYNNREIEFEKTELKPGLYLYTLKRIPTHLENINGLVINRKYYIELWINDVHFVGLDGTWNNVNLKYKAYYSIPRKTTIDIAYERTKNHKSISFISEVNLPNTTIGGFINILCFPILEG